MGMSTRSLSLSYLCFYFHRNPAHTFFLLSTLKCCLLVNYFLEISTKLCVSVSLRHVFAPGQLLVCSEGAALHLNSFYKTD